MDNGHGMSPKEAQSAMQLGAVDPSESRSSRDLGRFGMGLKTASFSQCKSLTLITRESTSEIWYGLRWDLDLVERENNWLVEELEPSECAAFLSSVEFPFPVGTAVIWNNFDRAIDPTATNSERDYDRRIMALIDHLALTFHRFITGSEVPYKVNLCLNGKTISEKDPFATSPEPNRQASTLLSDEIIRLGTYEVRIKAYILPHPTNFTHSFAQKVSPKGNHHAAQGIYIYRAGRLILSDGWLRLAKASEANKLARIQVDFGNDADALWRIDVRKSRVDLPATIREQLRRVIAQCSKKSSNTFTRRAKMSSIDIEPVWQRIYDRDKENVQYVLNRKHSALSEILMNIDRAETKAALIKLIESSLPLELIKNDISATNISFQSSLEDQLSKCSEIADVLFKAGIEKSLIHKALISDSNIGITTDQADKVLSKIGI